MTKHRTQLPLIHLSVCDRSRGGIAFGMNHKTRVQQREGRSIDRPRFLVVGSSALFRYSLFVIRHFTP